MRIITKNKFVYLNYDIQQEFEAGIVLLGHEVKSVKTGHINITDAIVKIYGNEVFITNMDIPLYPRTSPNLAKGYDPKGQRKLLLTKKEIIKLIGNTNKTGLTLVPIEIFENSKRFIKVKIGLGKLRKKVEKKQVIKERDVDRQAKKEIKNLRIG